MRCESRSAKEKDNDESSKKICSIVKRIAAHSHYYDDKPIASADAAPVRQTTCLLAPECGWSASPDEHRARHR